MFGTLTVVLNAFHSKNDFFGEINIEHDM